MNARVLGLLTVVVVTAAVSPATPAAAAPPARPAAVPDVAGSPWVTLPTGDRVELTQGVPRRVESGRADSPAQYLQYVADGEWFVVPVGAPVRTPAERARFNVSKLARRLPDATAYTAVPEPAAGARAAAAKFQLTLTVTDRAGRPADPSGVYLLNSDTGVLEGAGQLHYALDAGRYSVLSIIATPRPDQQPSITYLDVPQLRVEADTTVSLDARTATRVSIAPEDTAAAGGLLSVAQLIEVPSQFFPIGLHSTADPRFQDVYAGSAGGQALPEYSFSAWRRAEEAAVDLTATGVQRFAVQASLYDRRAPALSATLAVVDGGKGSAAELARIDARGKLVLVDPPANAPEEGAFHQVTARIAGAGARAAFVKPPANGGTAPALSSGTVLAMPVLRGVGPTASRLAAAGEVRVSVVTTPAPKRRYELVRTYRGAIPAAIQYRPRTRDLAKVQASYYAAAGPDLREVTATLVDGALSLQAGQPGVVAGGSERAEYFTPGAWSLGTGPRWGEELRAPSRELRARTATTYEWNRPVFTPSFSKQVFDWSTAGMRPPAVQRFGQITVELPLYSDAAGNGRTPAPTAGDEGSWSLHRNGELVGSSAQPGWNSYPVDPDRAAYRLTAANKRSTPQWTLATDVSAAWTFTSEGEPGVTTALPLLAVRMAPKVDLFSAAPGGREFRFPVTVERQPGSGNAVVSALSVDVSYDDGASWQPAGVTRAGQVWNVAICHPSSGFVSFRMKAADRDGNTVEQKVIRAYRLR